MGRGDGFWCGGGGGGHTFGFPRHRFLLDLMGLALPRQSCLLLSQLRLLQITRHRRYTTRFTVGRSSQRPCRRAPVW